MTAFNGTPLSYDANGNLWNDGTNTHARDARNHLTGISGASYMRAFIYDGFGRRMGKSIGGNVTQFLYDRLNPVQELDASNAPTANLLSRAQDRRVFPARRLRPARCAYPGRRRSVARSR